MRRKYPLNEREYVLIDRYVAFQATNSTKMWSVLGYIDFNARWAFAARLSETALDSRRLNTVDPKMIVRIQNEYLRLRGRENLDEDNSTTLLS